MCSSQGYWAMKTIRALRLERGWTQFDLAIAVDVRPQTVYLWESGRRQPQVSQMRKLGVVFGICSDDIDLISVQDAYASAGEARADRDGAEFATDQEPSGRGDFRAVRASPICDTTPPSGKPWLTPRIGWGISPPESSTCLSLPSGGRNQVRDPGAIAGSRR